MVEFVNVMMKLFADILVVVLRFFEKLFKTDIVLTLFIIVALVAGMTFNIVGVYWVFLFILIGEFAYSAYNGDNVNILDDYVMVIGKIKGFAGQKVNTTVQTPVNNNYHIETPPTITNNNQPPSEPPIHIQPPQPPHNLVQEPQPPVYVQQPIFQQPVQRGGFKINKKSNSWTNKGREENAIVDLENLLIDKIKFQDSAIAAVINGLKRASVSTSKSVKLNYLLTGPTGTGKTEMVKLVANGLKRPFRRYDMGNYKSKEQLWQLLGSPQGYIGGEGKLTEFVRNNPVSCILFDEIEKGCEEIYDFMLPMLDEGIVKDNRTDQTVDFSKTIIFFTTNQVTDVPLEAKENPEVIRDLILNKKFLRQELIGRIKNIVPFFEFGEDEIVEIVGVQVGSYVKGLLDPRNENIPIDCDDDVIEFISSKVDKKYGARNVHQQVERYLGNSITDVLFQRANKQVRYSKISVENGLVKVEVQ